MSFSWTQEEVENVNKWNSDEDAQLKYAFKLYGPQWDKIASFFKGKSQKECVQRWSQLQTLKSSKKIPWTKEEDDIVKNYVEKNGENWNEIAQILKNRTGNQIRNRYINKINAPPPRPWSQEEDLQLLQYYRQIGPKWVQIAKLMQQRSEIMVKNRFYAKYSKFLKPALVFRFNNQKLQVQGLGDKEEQDVKTLSNEPQKVKKVDIECQTDQCLYMCPRNVINGFEKLLEKNPNEPRKFCWIPIPIIRVFNQPPQFTNQTNEPKLQETLKEEEDQ